MLLQVQMWLAGSSLELGPTGAAGIWWRLLVHFVGVAADQEICHMYITIHETGTDLQAAVQAMLKDPKNADWAFQLVSVVTETIKCPSTMELYVIVEGATACAMPTVAAGLQKLLLQQLLRLLSLECSAETYSPSEGNLSSHLFCFMS